MINFNKYNYIDDNIIISIFIGKRQIKHHFVKELLKNTDNNIYQYLINRFNDSESIYETLLRIKYNIEKRPVCPICGNKVKFIGNDKNNNTCFTKYCSCKCAQNDKNVREKRYNTSVKLYGYGNNQKKMKETCNKKYGVDNVFSNNLIKEKIKQTCIKKYGVYNYTKTEEYHNIIKEKEIETINQRNNTKRKNNTFNTSNPENNSFILLQKKYNNIIRNYKSDKYPFNCDFYIPDLDLYIECNFHWTHGLHPYNENNIEDINKVNLWKSKNTKYYNNAIITWTIRDINKRKIAKENNLNYLEFFTFNKLKEYINNFNLLY